MVGPCTTGRLGVMSVGRTAGNTCTGDGVAVAVADGVIVAVADGVAVAVADGVAVAVADGVAVAVDFAGTGGFAG